MKEIRMNLWQTQIALLNKTIVAFELWLENPLPTISTEQIMSEGKDRMREYLTYDVKVEAYRMVVVNYLSALLGTRKNDKISIYNNQPKGKEELIAEFYENNTDFLRNLANMRDKVYSHFDLDFIDVCKPIGFEEVHKAIVFAEKVLKG